MDNVSVFISRLKLIGIEVELMGNYPWIYLTHINGRRVTERNASEHYFTIGYSKDKGCGFEYLPQTFKIIRKYGDIKNNTKTSRNDNLV